MLSIGVPVRQDNSLEQRLERQDMQWGILSSDIEPPELKAMNLYLQVPRLAWLFLGSRSIGTALPVGIRPPEAFGTR